MKKIFLLIIITFSTPIIILSQVVGFENKSINAFEEDSVVWKSSLDLNVEEIENPVSETILYGDTLINGLKWKVFNSDGIKGLVRTENAKVIFMPFPGHEEHYMREYRENETIIYDFSLEVGDHFGLGGKVIKIDSVMLNDGKKHRKLYFEYGHNYIEGLGSDVYTPFYMLFPTATMESYPTFMCCHVNDELLYMNPDYSDCDGNKVSNEIINNERLKVRIIFLDEILHITLEENRLFDVKVHNIQGMLVAQENKNDNEANISMEGMPKGIYVIQVISGNDTYTNKIIRK